MLQTSPNKAYIQCNGKRIFKSKSGFIFACENKLLVIKDSTKNGNNFRIYHEGALITLAMLASMFEQPVHVIVAWRDYVWKRIYSASTRKENLYETLANRRAEIVKAANTMVGTQTTLNLEEPKEPWKGYFSEVMANKLPSAVDGFRYLTWDSDKANKVATQLVRLARIKQKQREYCLHYGMNEVLTERNIHRAEIKFWEEEDKQKEKLKREIDNAKHDMSMLDIAYNAEDKAWAAQNQIVHSLQSRLDSARSVRSKHSKVKKSLASSYEVRKTQLEDLINKLQGYESTN